MDKELIKKRRSYVSEYDLVCLAEDLGLTPIRVGRKYFTLLEHDSVRINTFSNTFKRYSNGVWGDALSFVMEFGQERSNKFKSVNYSLYWLEKKMNIENTFDKNKTVLPEKEKVPLTLPERDNNCKRVFAYLIKTRMIDPEIVKVFVHRNILYQSKQGKNCVFVGYHDNKAVYASERGTMPGKRYMREMEGNDYNYGVNFDNENADTLIVTESVIDMMSLMTLKMKLNFHLKHSFLALGGVEKTECIFTYLKDQKNIKDVLICLDNDEAGKKATRRIIERLKKEYKHIKYLPVYSEEKDWNETLIKKTKELDNNESSMNLI